MNDFLVDYSELQAKLSKKRAFRLNDVKHKIKKVAFDVVRFVDNDKIDDLWQIHREGDDEYIVAMYDEDQQKTASTSIWSVVPDSNGTNLNVFCNNFPIKRVALNTLGIPSEDAHTVAHMMRKKFSTDQSFIDVFVKELSDKEREVFDEANLTFEAGK